MLGFFDLAAGFCHENPRVSILKLQVQGWQLQVQGLESQVQGLQTELQGKEMQVQAWETRVRELQFAIARPGDAGARRAVGGTTWE